ncbi:Uncharacterised protein [Vibrio cholerae]|nr:Uncharacterised protein [Vibrio cholerae]
MPPRSNNASTAIIAGPPPFVIIARRSPRSGTEWVNVSTAANSS